MDFKLKIWRQEQTAVNGKMVAYAVKDISADMSFLEMLDQLNENLILSGQYPISFDSDCREGICGQCGLFINGRAHGVLSKMVKPFILNLSGLALFQLKKT